MAAPVINYSQLAYIWAFSFITNGINLLMIEVMLKFSEPNKTRNFNLYHFVNLVPPQTLGYRKYYINLIGYLFSPFFSFLSLSLLLVIFTISSIKIPYNQFFKKNKIDKKKGT